MTNKTKRVEALLGQSNYAHLGHDPYYTGFFERFNRGEYFEAHDILEQLWLKDRNGANGAFYKGLIQLAGAFVHVGKQRVGPALSLLRLAEDNLAGYADKHERLDLIAVRILIAKWRAILQEGAEGCGLEQRAQNVPKIFLDQLPRNGCS